MRALDRLSRATRQIKHNDESKNHGTVRTEINDPIDERINKIEKKTQKNHDFSSSIFSSRIFDAIVLVYKQVLASLQC